MVNAILPVLLLIAAGYGFRRWGGIPTSAWHAMSQLTYFLFMPALEIRVLANAPLDNLPWAKLLTAVVGLLLFISLLLVLWQRYARPQTPATFTSLYQGAIRFNTFISLVLADQLYGDQGVAAVAIVAGVMILLINVLCILVFSLYIRDAHFKARKVVLDLATNPLILGCVIGLGLNFSGIGLHDPLHAFFDLVGKAALPVGLMAVGAALKPEDLRGNWEVINTAAIVQLIGKPLLAMATVSSLGLSGMLSYAVIICFTVPTAPSAYVLALQKGGDSQTMAAMITLQTLAAGITLPLMMSVQQATGFLG